MRLKSGSPLFFVLLWSVVALGADAFVLLSIARGLRTATWPEAPGTILDSSVKAHRGSKGTTYRLSVRYSYSVDGQSYEGTRHRHAIWSTTNSKVIGAQLQRYPAGAQVTVSHSPDATDSVLEPGASGVDIFLLLILFPFNVVLLATTRAALRSTRPEEVAVAAVQRSGRLHVVLNDTPPKLAGAYGAGGAAIAAVFGVGIPVGFDPRLSVALFSWAAVAAAGMAAAGWMRARVDSGHYDLVLSPRARRLSLPASSGRKERLDVQWDEVQAITVVPHEETTSRGVRTTYRPTLVLTGEVQPRQVVVFDEPDEGRAEALAAWLRAQLKLDTAAGPAWLSA
ncbi:DUF3592 domain-containing protein [Pyxidicoccus trucidator]|uniref:DUF3592 domain-containing protein n=1 Tax=Pyxidicoccus trucidator TaxID=2709662 RepID=UPI0013DAFBDE|nr:DUF3592 domain-containing protein [Pyxidicoccus trucidator]